MVKFAAKMTSVDARLRRRGGRGLADRVDGHIDIWTFARPLGSRNPNWLLDARPKKPRTEPMQAIGFDRLAGFAQDDALARVSGVSRVRPRRSPADAPPLRPARPATPELLAAARAALGVEPRDAEAARAFFVAHFEPRRIGRGFLTGYYEPWVEGALAPASARVHGAACSRDPTDLARARRPTPPAPRSRRQRAIPSCGCATPSRPI